MGDHRFGVWIAPGLLDRVGVLWAGRAEGDAVLLVHDEAVAGFAARVGAGLVDAGVRVVPAPVAPGEGSKTLAQVERLCRLAAREGIRRADGVVAVGGGMVGDLAGFVAASYQRGVRLAHVPTTLLAMVDSAIGGKTGVDLPEGKNYVGAVWQPEIVVMDPDALDTLPARELACGFAEVVKYGLLEGPGLFARVADWPRLPGPRDDLMELIRDCARHKIAVVAEDERDHGRRATLNLGHTVGHGIEAAAGYDRYRHGEAIALGLLAALRVSEGHLGLDPAWRERTRGVLERHDLPVRLDPTVGVDEVLAVMGRDKKADARALNMVLLAAPGEVLIRSDPDPALVRAAVDELSVG